MVDAGGKVTRKFTSKFTSKLTRRFLLGAGGLVGGGLVLGYAFAPNRLRYSAPGVAVKDETLLATWVKITPDNVVTVIVPHAEMGQGTHTGLPMMLADEMDADIDLVQMEQAPAHPNYANNALARGFALGDSVPDFLLRQVDFAVFKVAQSQSIQITGGSTAVRFTGQYGMRRAGAAAREMLLKAAAKEWDVPVRELRAAKSVVFHEPSGRTLTYGALGSLAAAFVPNPTPKLKSPEAYSVMGTDVPRYDIPAKVRGWTRYGSDTQLPGMLYGAVGFAPVHGGRVMRVDKASVAGRRGVRDVIDLGDCVVAVADNTWRAQQALAALAVDFDAGGNDRVSTDSIFAQLRAAIASDDAGKADAEHGNAMKVIEGSERVIEASYTVPFLAHAAMEPMNCTAHVNGKTCDVWVGHQNPLGVRAFIADLLNIDDDNVTVNTPMLGGGFGRRSEMDFVRVAVLTSQGVGAPVSVTYSRQEDLRHDFFRPAVVAQMRAALGADGLPVAWANRYSNVGENVPPDAPLIPYGIANQDIRGIVSSVHVQTGPWRSVGHSQHSFFNESFVDELAYAAGQDPYDYRRALLAQAPRALAVLDLAADKAGWRDALPEGRARGIALEPSFGTFVAQVAEVSLDKAGRVRVNRVTAAVDCGFAVHPQQVKRQIQSGIIYGLTAALYGEVNIVDGAPDLWNFSDYNMVRLADAPDIDVHILNSGAAFGGAGEPGTPPIAPAVVNAVFALTGERVRSLPLKHYQFKAKAPLNRLSMRMGGVAAG